MTDLSPDQIKAFLEAVKVLNGVHPVIGVIVASIGIITAVLTLINNLRTKKNTAANEATTKVLNDVEFRISKKAESTLKSAETIASDLRDSLDFKMNQLLTEMNNLKIVIAKVSISHEQRLSMIPKIQDRLEAVEKRGLETVFNQGKTDEKLEAFISELVKAQGRRKP